MLIFMQTIIFSCSVERKALCNGTSENETPNHSPF